MARKNLDFFDGFTTEKIANHQIGSKPLESLSFSNREIVTSCGETVFMQSAKITNKETVCNNTQLKRVTIQLVSSTECPILSQCIMLISSQQEQRIQFCLPLPLAVLVQDTVT